MAEGKLDLRNPLFVDSVTHELLVKGGGSTVAPSVTMLSDGTDIALITPDKELLVQNKQGAETWTPTTLSWTGGGAVFTLAAPDVDTAVSMTNFDELIVFPRTAGPVTILPITFSFAYLTYDGANYSTESYEFKTDMAAAETAVISLGIKLERCSSSYKFRLTSSAAVTTGIIELVCYAIKRFR